VFVCQLVALYVDFKLDESYTPSKISIRAGDGFHNLKVLFFFAARNLFNKLYYVLGSEDWICFSVS
jgi:hypothetical protein